MASDDKDTSDKAEDGSGAGAAAGGLARRYKIFLIVTAVSLLLDQVTKWWARSSLEEHQPIKFLGSFWEWELSYNRGSAFGLFRDLDQARIVLSIVGVVA